MLLYQLNMAGTPSKKNETDVSHLRKKEKESNLHRVQKGDSVILCQCMDQMKQISVYVIPAIKKQKADVNVVQCQWCERWEHRECAQLSNE